MVVSVAEKRGSGGGRGSGGDSVHGREKKLDLPPRLDV